MNHWLPAGSALLFCPADRPDRYAKAHAVAEFVIIDLEDSVAADRKAEARETLRGQQSSLDPDRTLVRINGHGTPFFDDDVATLRGTPFRRLLLPKAERRSDVEVLDGFEVVITLESQRGVANAQEVARAENCVGVSWGGEDLTASVGGWASRDDLGSYLDLARHARVEALMAAACSDVVAIDTPYLNIADIDGLARETNEASRMGFGAKVAIHPSQVAVIRRSFAPPSERVVRAKEVLAASGGEAVQVGGQMVDVPLVVQAQRVVALAAATEAEGVDRP